MHIFTYNKYVFKHDERLVAVLSRLEKPGLTLNKATCEFSKAEVKFLGHVLSQDGVRTDPDKVIVIVNMVEPTTVKKLLRFLGMVNQMRKFTHNLAEITKPLRDLLSKKNQWTWGPAQEQAFSTVKDEEFSSSII